METQNVKAMLVADIEAGRLLNRTLISFGVVGLVDMVASSQISNSMDLLADWELKTRFLSAATKRAEETGMIMLNHTGDGFLFLANYSGREDWAENLMRFHELLTADFALILKTYSDVIGHVESGLRFGVSAGPMILGWIGDSSHRQFMAVSPEVNLAARLCACAQVNEMVLSSRVAALMSKNQLGARKTLSKEHSGLKGFSDAVPAIHVSLVHELVEFEVDMNVQAAEKTQRRTGMRLIGGHANAEGPEHTHFERRTRVFKKMLLSTRVLMGA